MDCGEEPVKIVLRDFSIREFSERIREMDQYSALKEIQKSYGILSFEVSKAPIFDITHLLTSLSLIDHEVAIRFVMDNRDKLAKRILEADYYALKEFILGPYRVNRAMGTFIVKEFEEELREFILRDLEKFSLLIHGLVISAITRCSEKVARKIIESDKVLEKICNSIEFGEYQKEDLERIGAFFCSLYLGSRKLAEDVSTKCKKSILNRFEKRYRDATFEELGVFLSCISRANKRIREEIRKRYGKELERIFNENFDKYSISDTRVVLEGISFTDPQLALELYKKYEEKIVEKLKEAGEDKTNRFLQTMKKANRAIYETLKNKVIASEKQKSH